MARTEDPIAYAPGDLAVLRTVVTELGMNTVVRAPVSVMAEVTVSVVFASWGGWAMHELIAGQPRRAGCLQGSDATGGCSLYLCHRHALQPQDVKHAVPVSLVARCH
jgi:hypothetical protein